MRYGSVCSGIEAASVAWESLGWQPAWFAEIEAFPSAVLAHHWPDVTNLGDMTGIAAAVHAGDVEAPDMLVGGTPCQAFSIAGLRYGLADKRGQLSLSYVELANAIDDKRRERGEEEAITVWENVPGVLSSKDNAFGCFIGALAGESCELQPAGGKWPNAGCVYGPSRIVAWRVLDAQFFGVAQRRRRVFVVASARKEFDPAEVLFEFDSLRRDTPPRREPQTAVTTDTGSGIEGGSHWDNPANPHPTLNQANNIGGIGASNQEVFSQRGAGLVSGAYSDISRTLLAKENDSTAEDLDTYILAYGGGNTGGNIDVATACTAHGVRMDFDTETFAVHGTQDPDTNHELAHTLGRNHGQENVIITEPYTIAIRGREEGSTVEVRNDGTANALLTPNGGRAGIGGGAVGWGMQVRRLTPVECERLQGFPDNHTLISWRGKDAADCPDGQRYKAIGNSMAVPVMRWIGERIAEALPIQEPTPRRWQRPFLKWAGGKYSLLPELERLIPAGKRLIEPFVGGGSVFLNSDKHERFLLADINADLINLYQMLTIVPDSVIAEAMKAFRHLNDAENYTAIREAFNAWQLNAIERAAAFLYLNRHCFNGLMRYNLDGFFNVGWGKYKAPYFPEKELMAFRKKSSACVFMNAGFERTLRLAGDGDVVYCDPPYEPMPGTAGFTSYASGGFSWDSQVALAESCVAAHQRGAKVFISNSTAPRVIELYERHGFTLHRVNARRSISSKGSTRETANDIVASLGI
ncbi:Dam family site-specific DNA-(adenine-N6)-methyltransferase [Salmonella enterica]|uniref:Dam family site-specific DNA-(adenine-N6)-methyltransferase n=1 Tax=Salmonella enterica TaxID=28901 RepID=UPI0009ABEBCE|nr:Dam family site-specific DNA-(adenine-N6)-methyltransferase [Salmonella enterica]ECX8847975.1 Dam family site-specific DNA-(adenine-N6)-methyltransferase [Salmonella enterica]EGE9122732.1 Dam family site-specific DNA-(adenine-N6)-methyltransferase [Salmonella enterica]EJK3327747.1 Dam family site-specific DNA-(adenine-N6)-methyltransferase [Salmonella enterica]EJO2469829.1 Dam family site-specific DNA-(adenine-N6)-methyltransferase [Salmonella enterica]EKO4836313.1 Dam family site-specific 